MPANIICEPLCRYPHEALEIARTSVNFCSGKSGTPYVLFLAKVMPNILVKFIMTLLKNRTYGVLRLMHGPRYLSTNLSDSSVIFLVLTFFLFYNAVQTCPRLPALRST